MTFFLARETAVYRRERFIMDRCCSETGRITVSASEPCTFVNLISKVTPRNRPQGSMPSRGLTDNEQRVWITLTPPSEEQHNQTARQGLSARTRFAKANSIFSFAVCFRRHRYRVFRYLNRPFTTAKICSTFALTDDFSCSRRLICALDRADLFLL